MVAPLLNQKTEFVTRSRAPVRIDFGGGWTDVALFTEESKGLVVNAAIDIFSYVTVKNISKSKNGKDNTIRIYSADFDLYEEAEEVRQLEYNGNIDLAKAAIRQLGLSGGIEIITRSNAPAGSGLGTSASMGVALIGALSAHEGRVLLPYEFAEQASLIEQKELHILGGKQDHYASALGGISFMEFIGEEVKVSKINLSKDTICELEKSIVLCYTGKSRLSGNIHQMVREAYLNKDPNTRQALRELKVIAENMKNALLREDLKTFAELLNDNWKNQKALHPSVTNPEIDALFDIALSNGALGGKACGAGGGGCLIFYAKPDCEHIVRKKLIEAGVTVIDFNFEFNGLQIWKAKI